MRRTFVLLTITALLLSLATSFAPVLAGGNDAPIRLKAATFRPGLGEKPDFPPGLAVAALTPGINGYYLVQFSGPIQAAWKEALSGLGADILDYVPDYAFKVRMTPGQARKATRLEKVTWIGDFHPAYKLSPDLARQGTGLYSVRVERGANAGLTAASIAAGGATIVSRQGSYLRVLADASQLNAIARVLDVAWVQNLALQEKHNEYGAGVIMGANTANANGYNGSSQIVAVADTGIGGGTANSAHPDIPSSRVAAIFDWAASSGAGCYNAYPDGAQDVDSGHGTHVSGSVLSDGGAGGIGQGTAPAANLVFQAIEDYVDMISICALQYEDGYYLMGIPDDIGDLFQQAYTAGARVHSDSWGHDAAGDYDMDAVNADAFVWGHPDMAILTSAGNAGVDANSNGYVDEDSMGSPATAKNLITVGASENARADNYPCDTISAGCSGQNSIFTYGSAWPADFPANPVANDSSAGNVEQLAAFSSRGPTDDGRIKPDVVAPGTWVLSGYSDLYQQYYDGSANPQNGAWQYDGWGYPLNADYKYMGGTSMSTPLTAGGAAVVRDYYQKAQSHSASAALVKATLINSAVDLLDENNDGQNDNDYPIPNVHEGWGRVNLAAATDGSHQYVDQSAGLNTGGSAGYNYGVTSSATPFKVSLVWSDYPSTETAGANLVNNLNLKVTAPGGTVYWGNQFSGGWSTAGGSAEAVNNVENVYVAAPAVGTWTVEVLAANVPQGPQPYALVVDGVFGAVDNPPTVNMVSPAQGATVSGSVLIQIDATDVEDDDDALAVEWDVDGGDPLTASYNVATGYYEATWDSSSVSDGSHTINARAIDSGSNIGSDSNSVTVDNVADPTVHVGNLDGAKTTVRNKWTATVTVTVHGQAETPVSGATVTGSWGDGATGSGVCTTGAGGTCEIAKANISNKVPSVSFTVTGVSHASLVYAAGDNHDPDGNSDGTTIFVPPPANQAPAVSITAPSDGATFASGATIDFAGTAGDAEDGDLTSGLVWTSSIDGEIGTGGSFSAQLSDGAHIITASITDSGGAGGSDSVSITVGTPQTTPAHVGDLDGSSTPAARSRWNVEVWITVHDQGHGPVANATVGGAWSNGATGGASCTTDANGQCSVSKGNLKSNASSATFTVESVSATGYSYEPADNHDPDGDSNGTQIIVAAP